MHRKTAIILSMLFLGACKTIDLGKDEPPADRLVCAVLPAKPEISPLKAFEASNGAMVYLKADVDARDAKIGDYVVNLRGAWFSCSNQVAWNRDYWAH